MTLNEYYDLRNGIGNRDQRYRTLHGIAVGFMKEICDANFLQDLKRFARSYSIVETSDEKVTFSFLGYDWLIQFHHDIQNGLLKYKFRVGEARSDWDVSEIRFDSLGRVNDDRCLPGGSQYEHIRFLAEDAPRFLESRMHLVAKELPVIEDPSLELSIAARTK